MKNLSWQAALAAALTLALLQCLTLAQDLGQQSIDDFDHAALGPWSDIDRTTLAVPKVANDSIVINGEPTSEKYGGFIAQEVVPTVTGWVLNFPGDRAWDNVDDSNFRFWLAHDDTYFYIGVDVTDDVVNVDNENARNWLDDSVEILFDPLNTRYDTKPNENSDYGGHDGISADGSMRGWDPAAMAKNAFGEGNFAKGVDWTYGEDGDIWAVGKETATGYALDIRYHKRLFEDPDIGNKLADDYVMGFNLTIDDDDKHGDGPNGDQSRTNDEDLSYYWAQRERLVGWNADEAANYTADEIAKGVHEEFFERKFDPGGRLTAGATGQVILTSGLDPNIFGPNVADLGKGSSVDERPGSVQIRNIGSANMLNITSVTISGENKDNFTVTSPLPLQIAPLSSGELEFRFNGKGVSGAFGASLEVMSDDPGEAVKVINVSASAVDPVGPAARYTLDESEGTIFPDITGNGRHAEVNAGGGTTTLGQAALASGTSVRVASGGAIQAGARGFGALTDFSMSLWFQASTLPSDLPGTVLGKGDGDTPTLALLLTGGNLSLLTSNAEGLLATSNAPITAGQTHHVVLVHDESNGQAALYVDGAQVATETGLDPLNDSAEGFLYFGAYRGALPVSAQYDEIQIYDRALTVEDVSFLHDNPSEALRSPGGGGGEPQLPEGAIAGGPELKGAEGLAGFYWSREPASTPTARVAGDPDNSDNPLHRADGPGLNAGYADDNVFNTPATGSFSATSFTYQGNDLTPISEWLGADAGSYSGTEDDLGDGLFRMAGYLYIDDPGERTFQTTSDDGSVLYINDQLVIDNDNGHGNETVSNTFNFPAAGYYPVDVRYFNGDWTNDAGEHGGANFLGEQGFENLVQTVQGVDPFYKHTVAAGPKVEAGSLVALWDFNDSSSPASTMDAIGNQAGELVGDATYGADASGISGIAGDRAMDFSAGESASVRVAGEFLNELNATDSVSIAFWQKLNNLTNQTTFKMRSPSSSGNERGWSVHTPWGGNDTIFFDSAGCCAADTTRVSKASPAGLDYTEWHHFVFVKNDEAKQVYIDGVLFLEGGGADPLPTDISELLIGSSEGSDANDGETLESMDGVLDNFAIFSEALSAQAAAFLASGGSAIDAGLGNIGDGGRPVISGIFRSAAGIALRFPDGTTYDVEFSSDLVTWESIASGITGNYIDDDAARASADAAYYRGVVSE